MYNGKYISLLLKSLSRTTIDSNLTQFPASSSPGFLYRDLDMLAE